MHAAVREKAKTEAILIVAPLKIESSLSGAPEGGSRLPSLLSFVAWDGISLEASDNNSQDLALGSQNEI